MFLRVGGVTPRKRRFFETGGWVARPLMWWAVVGGCVDCGRWQTPGSQRTGWFYTHKKGLRFAGNFVRNAEHILAAGDGTM